MTNNLSAFIAAALFSTTLGTASFAQSDISDGNVNIVFVSRADRSKDSGKDLPPLNQMTQQNARTEVENDTKLKSILEKHGVELNNVVGIETASNGGKIVYVK